MKAQIMKKIAPLLGLLAFFLVPFTGAQVTGAQAQETTAPQATTQDATTQDATEPDATTQPTPLIERTGDWAYICPDDQSTQDCFVAFRVFETETQQPLMEVAFGRVKTATGNEEIQGRITLLDGVMLKPGVTMTLEGGLARTAGFDICGRGSCLASFTLDQELLAGMKNQNSGTVTFVIPDGQRREFPLSLNGFTAVMKKAFGV